MYCCLSLLVLQGFLLLIVVDNQNIANGQETTTGIRCEVKNVQHWYFSYADRDNEIGIKCNAQCSPKCICTLDDIKVTRNCTSDNVTVYPVIYPPDAITYLNWDNSVLHHIKPEAFWRFGSELESLHLTNISLQHLQPGVFSGLSGVTYLDLSFNQLHKISPGAFRELVRLTRLKLDGNVLKEIAVGVFRGFIRLELLDLHSNRLNMIAEDAFEDLAELNKLWLNDNNLSEINVGMFRGLIRLEALNLSSNRLNSIAEGAFEDLVELKRLWINDNNLSEINVGVFRGLIRLDQLELDSNRLNGIAEGAFEDLVELKIFWLYDNNLSEMNVGVFRGLIRLEELDLSGNNLNRIAEDGFEGLVELKDLALVANHLSEINVGVFRGLKRLEELYLRRNILKWIAEDAFKDLVELKILWLEINNLSEINVGVFRGLIRLEVLYLYSNRLNRIAECAFEDLEELRILWLDDNNLSEINVGVFRGLIQLEELYLADNRLHRIAEGAFWEQLELNKLSLENNFLSEINVGALRRLVRLEYLDILNNSVNRIAEGAFQDLVQLKQLDLRENPLLWIEEHALCDFNDTVILAVTEYATCCFTTANCSSSSPSPYLTCKRLLPYDLLRIAIWFVCSFAIVGNIFVFCTRFKNKRQQRDNVQFLLIMNLSLSDFIMGIYLIILLSADLYYTEYFPSHSKSWRHSMLCRVAGALAVVSSEASAFFITLITIDRFLGIKYTFSKFRLSGKSTRIIVTLLWMIALSISIAVFVLSKEDSDIYAVSEVCVGLPISRVHIYSKEETSIAWSEFDSETDVYRGDRIGMFFSIALFTGLNMVCFFIIGYCYVAIFIYVKQTTKQSGRSRNLNHEIRMAIRMSLIVFTDFCCWVPIGVLSILVQTGVVEVDPVAYAWIATFVLPINSSLNPFLYTLASCVSDKVKCTARTEASKGQNATERMPMRGTSECLEMKRDRFKCLSEVARQ